MQNNKEIKELIVEMQSVLNVAVELTEENRELKIKLAKFEEPDETLEKNLSDFRNKLQYFTSKREKTATEEIQNENVQS